MTIAQRIRTDIEERIHSGEWLPGTRIPFEHELVKQYGCSRATVSKALEGLARAGLIERRRKAGSFVAKPQIHSGALDVPDLAKLVAEREQVYRWQLLEARAARTAELAGEIKQPACFIHGLHLSDGEPLAIERRFIALATVPEIRPDAFVDVPPGTWLLDHVPWTSARHQIRAIEADGPTARALGMRRGGACLEVERWTWQHAAAVTHVVQRFRGDRFDLVGEFGREPI